jgi:hypothetical protein
VREGRERWAGGEEVGQAGSGGGKRKRREGVGHVGRMGKGRVWGLFSCFSNPFLNNFSNPFLKTNLLHFSFTTCFTNYFKDF